MRKVKVFKVKVWDQQAGENRLSSRMATEKGAALMGGEVLVETGIEIEANQLERGEEWTERNFAPRTEL